ncbi:iron chelate uptake ABC transporter family permease subunit, partial [Rhodococcus hoagii]|nr:iron chelate uptake ABC transporter family permease subunit [Prescottella equi]
MSVLNSLPESAAGDSAKVPSRPALRIGPLSLVLRPFMIVVNVALLVLLFLLVCIGIGRGDFPLSIAEVTNVLFGGGSKVQRFIVMDLRLPRALVAVLIGIALGISGAITQSIARNALASPDILGITSGASAAAVALIVLGGGARSWVCSRHSASRWRHWPCLLTAAVIYLLAWRNGVEGYRLILIVSGSRHAHRRHRVAAHLRRHSTTSPAPRSGSTVPSRRRVGQV